MRRMGEHGEFFPMTVSPIPYNHSLAQRYFPLTQAEVAERGLVWYEEHFPDAAAAIDPSLPPDIVSAVDDPIVVRSEQSGRLFRITSREIQQFRRFNVP